MSTTYLIQNAALLGGEPTDLLLEDGVIKEIGKISTGSMEGPRRDRRRDRADRPAGPGRPPHPPARAGS